MENIPSDTIEPGCEALSSQDLLAEFQLFRSAAEDLEQSYAELKQRAERIDLELQVKNEQLLASLAEVERLARIESLVELSLGIAHEIRNPMNGILGFACMMKKNPQSPKLVDWAGRVEEGVRRVDKIIKDLLAFARPEQRRAMLCKRLDAWLEEADAAELGVAIELQGDAGNSMLLGHEEALGKVFSNLIRNSGEAGASRISVDAQPLAAGRVRISFEDDGSGIDEEIVDKLFTPFVGTKSAGSGLGLAFCARALEAMGASIRAEPKADGAKFVLEFSAGQA